MRIGFQWPIIIRRKRLHIAATELGFGPRICRALRRGNIVYLDEIDIDRIRYFRNLGVKSIEKIGAALNGEQTGK